MIGRFKLLFVSLFVGLFFVGFMLITERVLSPRDEKTMHEVSLRKDVSTKMPNKEVSSPFREIVESLERKDTPMLDELSEKLILRFPESLPELEAMIQSKESEVREFSGMTLARIGTAEAVKTLLAAIKEEGDFLTRENLIEALRGVTNVAGVPTLARCAEDLQDLNLHRVCRDIISGFDDPAAASTVIALLEQGQREDNEPLVYALAHMQSEKAIPVLVSGASLKHKEIAKPAMQALGNMQSRFGFRALFEILAANDGNWRGEIATAVALETALSSKNNAFVNECERVIENSVNPRAIKAAIESLVIMSIPEASIALDRQYSKVTDGSIRSYLESGLAKRKTLWSAQAPNN